MTADKTPEVMVYQPGHLPGDMRPGDLLFKDGTEPIARIIKLVSGGPSHVAIVKNSDGTIIHAVQRGVVKDHISKYQPERFTYVRLPLKPIERLKCMQWLEWAVGSGFKYDFVTLFMMPLFWMSKLVLPGGIAIIGGESVSICSGLAAQMLRGANYRFTQNPATIDPGTLKDDLVSGRAIPPGPTPVYGE